uniref:NADH-ubiquinone oxidoreductase chain 3 n=1 Tax=Aleurochiton aceris TaxID=266942 RepID=Q697H0_ALEAC|nr:NADH dehydrogenase subunit 3 [Aleurochiton aceris]
MMNLMIYMVMILLVMTALMIMFKLTSYNLMMSRNKNSTFKCGFDLLSSLRLPFSLHFYVISIIFLIFDVELILLMPFIFVMKMNNSMKTYMMMLLFFTVLMVGFIYEWWMGLLNWLI